MFKRVGLWFMAATRRLAGVLGRRRRPSPVDMLFDQAIEFAVEANELSAAKYEHAPNNIVRDAFYAISQDAVITHRAVGALTRTGWTGASAVLLRTLMDLQISAVAILRSKDKKLAAFRYFYSSFRRLGRDQKAFGSEFRTSARAT